MDNTTNIIIGLVISIIIILLLVYHNVSKKNKELVRITDIMNEAILDKEQTLKNSNKPLIELERLQHTVAMLISERDKAIAARVDMLSARDEAISTNNQLLAKYNKLLSTVPKYNVIGVRYKTNDTDINKIYEAYGAIIESNILTICKLLQDQIDISSNEPMPNNIPCQMLDDEIKKMFIINGIKGYEDFETIHKIIQKNICVDGLVDPVKSLEFTKKILKSICYKR